MARYQVPPDPRNSDDKRPRRMRHDMQAPTPWRYLLLGLVVAGVSLVIALALANAFLTRAPLPTSQDPTLIILTAPPSAVPSQTPILPTPTVIPTFTPIPTPDTATAPDEVTVGYYATVFNTGGAGVRVRGGPSTSNSILTTANEEELLLVIGGPEVDNLNSVIWWQVELQDGTQGWAAGEFLAPAAGPPP